MTKNIGDDEQQHRHENNPELLKRLLQQDREAFNQFFKKYYAEIETFVNSRVKKTDEASEITSDAFLKLWKSLPKGHEFNDLSHLIAYLYRIANNLTIDFLKKEKKRANAFLEYIKYEKVDINELGITTWKAVMLQKIREAFMQLSEQEREVLYNVHWQNKSLKEVAEHLGITYENAKKIKRRSETKIGNILKNFLYLFILFETLLLAWKEISHFL